MNTIAGVDIGYGDVKIVSDNLTTAFPTIITPAREKGFETGIGDDILPIEVNGKQFHVGTDAEKAANNLDIRYKTWFLEDEYLAFYKKGVSLLEPGFITVVTGLPVAEYNECKDKLRNRLKGIFQFNNNFYRVEEVRVMPQPFGSFYNFFLDNSGNVSRENAFNETIGIIDIGYRTTDYILISNGKYTEGEVSGTIDTGVSNLTEGIRKKVAEKYSLDLNVNRARVAIGTKEVKIYGKTEKINQIVEDEITYWANFITHKTKTSWKSGAHVDEILLVGGGAEVFKEHLKKLFPHLKVPANPSFSNAAGYYKYGKMLLKK